MLLDPEINANALPLTNNADKAQTLVRRVGPPGLEPGTYGLKVRSSTD